MKVRTMFSKDH